MADALAWQDFAVCRDAGPDLFFGFGDDQDTARAVCAACPVREPCGEHAIVNNENGVWGGMSEEDRLAVRRRRRAPRRRPARVVVP